MFYSHTFVQTQGIRTDVVPYKSIMSAFSRICHEEGLRGLYRSLLAMKLCHFESLFPVTFRAYISYIFPVLEQWHFTFFGGD